MRYFFDTANGGFHADPEGTVYEGIEQARAEATIYAGEILQDNPNAIWANNELTVMVKDDKGLIIFTITVLLNGSSAIPESLR
jgi:hypothetical protein